MSPTLRPGQLVVGRRRCRDLNTGDIVIFLRNGREIIKRVQEIKESKMYVVGDNASRSTDSRHYGCIDVKAVVAKLIWPR